MGKERRKEIERHLTEEELDALLSEADDEHVLRRIIFVKSLYKGDTLEEAADRVGRSDATASRWANQWNHGGMEELAPDFGGGRPPKLDEQEQERFLDLLAEDEPWTSQEIQQLLDQEFDVEFHPDYLSSFLRSLGLKYAKPRPQRPSRPENADEILEDRLDDAVEESDEPQNHRESDKSGRWTLDKDVSTDGGTVVGFFRRGMAATDR